MFKIIFLIFTIINSINGIGPQHSLVQPLTLETNHRNMQVRLNNHSGNRAPSPNITEGRVEVSFDFGRSWRSICSSQWSFREGNVVCHQLKLGYASVATQNQKYGNTQTNPWGMVGTLCRGSESCVRDCYREAQYPRACNATNKNVAMVKCVQKLPDLTLVVEEIQRSTHLDIQPMSRLTCAMEEKCVSNDAYQIVLTQPEAERKLLRFTTRAKNIGTLDFSPYHNFDRWEWHQCHMHYHSMEAFADFDVYNMKYQKVAQGHKASFCLMDSGCDRGIRRKYSCGNRTQGISVGCWDTYGSGLDCQWVDVTNLPVNKTYILRVAVNPDYMLGEISFENNGAECLLQYTGVRATTKVSNCQAVPLWYGK